MKLPLSWLKDYVKGNFKVDELSNRLTMAGLEVETIHGAGANTVFELEITPNRADCLNILGLAREIAAITNKSFKAPIPKKLSLPKKACDITIVDKAKCSRYIGTVIEGVRIAATNPFIKSRIESVGSRSINNVVDITNFSLWENGQPLHAFDYDKLEGGKIIVRPAKDGEKILAINGEEYKLDPSILVIADARKAVAIAGIMGGKETEVTSSTKNILLESAYFDQVAIRRAARKLGLTSDSCYRFERGVDFEGVLIGSHRATTLILENAGGKIVAYKDVSQTNKNKNSKIATSVDEINKRLGSNETAATYKNIFKKLDFIVGGSGNKLTITAPSFRRDVKQAVDVAEEAARIIGYDRMPSAMPTVRMNSVGINPKRRDRETICNALIGQGFDEVITYSMLSRQAIDKSNQGVLPKVKVKNPLSIDLEWMRPSLLPSLLSIVLSNFNHGQKDLKFFELGKKYTPDGEKDLLSLIISGASSDWRGRNFKADLYDLKGAVENALRALRLSLPEYKSIEVSWLQAGEAAEIFLAGESIGHLGKVNTQVLRAWDIKSDNIYFAEVALEKIYKAARRELTYQQPSGFPAIGRDISLGVQKNITFAQIKEIISASGGNLLKDVRLLEEYLGDKIASDQRGLVISLSFQSKERTLREAEVDEIFNRVSQAIISQTGAVKR